MFPSCTVRRFRGPARRGPIRVLPAGGDFVAAVLLAVLLAALWMVSGGCAHDVLSDPLFLHHAVDSTYAGGHISSQAAGDIDRDGFIDIVIRSGKSGPGEIAWYRNPGRWGAVWTHHVIAKVAYPDGPWCSGTGLALHDIDGDGRLDVVAGAKDEHGLRGLFWWRCPASAPIRASADHSVTRAGVGRMPNRDGASGIPSPWARFPIAVDRGRGEEEFPPHDIHFSDLDADGRQDLVFSGSSAQGTWWAPVPRAPRARLLWTLHRVGPPQGQAFAGMDTGDMDGDGRVDIVRSGVWYRSVGPLHDPRWQENAYGLVNEPPSNVVLFDTDGDGRLDIVVASGHNPRVGEIVVYESRGQKPGHWRSHRIAQNLFGPENLVVWRDSSGVEIVTAELDFRHHRAGRRRVIRLTRAAGTSRWIRHRVYTGPNYHVMHGADLDNDGDLDLYAGSFTEPDGLAHVDAFENKTQ